MIYILLTKGRRKTIVLYCNNLNQSESGRKINISQSHWLSIAMKPGSQQLKIAKKLSYNYFHHIITLNKQHPVQHPAE